MLTSRLNEQQYKTLQGSSRGLLGVAISSGVALLLSAMLDYPRGIDGAVTLFALSVGGVSAGMLEHVSRKWRRAGVPIFLLIMTFAVVSAGMWLLSNLIPR